jgi:hypothetical protein
MPPRRIPLWLKIGWSVWVAVWIPLYWRQYGPTTFLWLCDVANLLILAGLWTESALLFSWQAVSVLLVQIAYTADVLGRLLFGRHLIGGTEWMFQDDIAMKIRVASFFMHTAAPPVLIWGVWRLGYDRRALRVQLATACVLLPASWFCGEKLNLNWVWGPFNRPQRWMAPGLFVPLCILGYSVLLFLPTHLLLSRFFGRTKEPAPPL